MNCDACQYCIAFLQRVYKLNNTGTRMLDSTNRIILRLI